jgi:hypothetical protein
MKRRWLAALGGVLLLLCCMSPARAGNWSVITRYFQPGPTYGYNKHFGYQDCMMPWQPVRSVMHYNVLPPGMLRPPPLPIPSPWLAPRTPSFSSEAVSHGW